MVGLKNADLHVSSMHSATELHSQSFFKFLRSLSLQQMSIYVSCIGEGVRVILTSQKELGSISPDFLKGTEMLVQFHKDLVVLSHERNSILCFLLSKAIYSFTSLLIFCSSPRV